MRKQRKIKYEVKINGISSYIRWTGSNEELIYKFFEKNKLKLNLLKKFLNFEIVRPENKLILHNLNFVVESGQWIAVTEQNELKAISNDEFVKLQIWSKTK